MAVKKEIFANEKEGENKWISTRNKGQRNGNLWNKWKSSLNPILNSIIGDA